MGYEFCSNGGGVLGANSTGLFPSPCMSASAYAPPMSPMSLMSTPVRGPMAAFGKRRRTVRRM